MKGLNRNVFQVILFILVSISLISNEDTYKSVSIDSNINFDSVSLEALSADDLITLYNIKSQVEFYYNKGNSDFTSTIDPILNIRLDSSGIKNDPNVIEIGKVLKNFKNKTKTEQKELIGFIKDGSIKYSLLLSEEMQNSYKKDIKFITTSPDSVSGEYTTLLSILRIIGPELEVIVSHENLEEQFLKTYIDTRAIKESVKAIVSFVELNKKSTLFSFLFPNKIENEMLIKYVNELKIIKHLPDNRTFESLGKWKIRRNKREYELEKNIFVYVEKLSTRIDIISKRLSSIQNELNEVEDGLINQTNALLKESIIKSNELLINNDEYIDIKKNKDDRVWVRLKPKKGVLERLNKNKMSLETSVNVFLVHKAIIKRDDAKWIGEKLNPKEKLNQEQKKIAEDNKKLAQESMQNLTVEIPLGIEVNQVTLNYKESINNNYQASYIVHDSMPTRECFNLEIELKDIGIWTRLKTDYKQQIESTGLMNLPKELGIEIHKIKINPKNWNTSIEFIWQQPDFLKSLNKPQPFKVSIQDLNSEIDTLQFQEYITELMYKKVSIEMNKSVKETNNELAKLLWAHRITKPLFFKANKSGITSSVEFIPQLTKLLGDSISTVHVIGELVHGEGRAFLKFSSPPLPIENLLRNKIKTFVGDFEVGKEYEKYLQNIEDNLGSFVEFRKFNFNVNNKELYGEIILKGTISKTIDICLKEGEDLDKYFTNHIVPEVERFVLSNIEMLIKDVLKNYVIEGINDYCDSFDTTRSVSFYGLKFDVVGDLNCENQEIKANITCSDYTSLKGNILINQNGIKLEKIDVNLLEKVVISNLKKLHLDYKYVSLHDPHFENQILVADLKLTIAELGVDEKCGKLKLLQNGDLRLDNYDIGNTLLGRITALINKNIKKNPIEIKLGEYQGISLVKLKKLEKDKLTFETKISLIEKVIIPAELIVNYKPNFYVELSINEEDLKREVINAIIGVFEVDITPGVSVKIENLKPLTGEKGKEEIGITGEVKLTIEDYFSLPTMQFTITRKEIKFEPLLEFTLPIVIPIPPYFALIDPGVKLDLKNSKITFNTVFTLGTSEEARSWARLIKLNAGMGVHYGGDQAGNLFFNGDLIVISAFAIMKGEGGIQLNGVKRFHMNGGTVGSFKKIIDFDQTALISAGKDYDSIVNSVQLKMLGLDFEAKSEIIHVKAEKIINLDFTGECTIPIGELGAEFYSKLELNKPQSLYTNAIAELKGELKVDKFELSSVNLKLNARQAYIKFKALGVSLSATAPSLNGIDKDLILDQILQLFDFNPEVILTFLKEPHLKLSSDGKLFGENTDDGGDGDGDGDGDSDGGNGSSVIPDDGEIGVVKLTSPGPKGSEVTWAAKTGVNYVPVSELSEALRKTVFKGVDLSNTSVEIRDNKLKHFYISSPSGGVSSSSQNIRQKYIYLLKPIKLKRVFYNAKNYYCLTKKYQAKTCFECDANLDVHTFRPLLVYDSSVKTPRIVFSIDLFSRIVPNIKAFKFNYTPDFEFALLPVHYSYHFQNPSFESVNKIERINLNGSKIDSMKLYTSHLFIYRFRRFKDVPTKEKRKLKKEYKALYTCFENHDGFIFMQDSSFFLIPLSSTFIYKYIPQIDLEVIKKVIQFKINLTKEIELSISKGNINSILQIPKAYESLSFANKITNLGKQKFELKLHKLEKYIKIKLNNLNETISIREVQISEANGKLELWHIPSKDSLSIEITFSKNSNVESNNWKSLSSDLVTFKESDLSKKIEVTNDITFNTLIRKIEDKEHILRPTILTLLSKESKSLYLYSANRDVVKYIKDNNQNQFSLYYYYKKATIATVTKSILKLESGLFTKNKGDATTFSSLFIEHKNFYDKIVQLMIKDSTAIIDVKKNKQNQLTAVYTTIDKIGYILENKKSNIPITFSYDLEKIENNIKFINNEIIKNNTGIYSKIKYSSNLELAWKILYSYQGYRYWGNEEKLKLIPFSLLNNSLKNKNNEN